MELLKRIKSAYNVLTSKSLYNSLGTIMRNMGYETQFNPDKQMRGITYKAVDTIGMSVSTYLPLVTNKKGDVVENHPLTVLAKQPNPRQSASDFFHLWAMLYEIYGETYWYLARGERTQKVKEIYLLDPAKMELVISTEGELLGYKLHKSNGREVPFMPEEIIYDKRPNVLSEWRGMSLLERASTYIDTERTTADFTLNYMKNNASPSGIVTLPNMDKEAFKQFCERWREGYEGPENAGKTAFIRGDGVDFKAVGATLRDVDQKVTRDMAKEDVLMMFGVPKPLLGLADQTGLGRANVENLYYIFNKSTIDPLMERLDRIWEQIAKVGGLGEVTDIQHESPIPEDKEYKLLRNEKAVNKWITIDEARAEDGLDPLPGGKGSELISQSPQSTEVMPTKSFKKVVLKQPLTKAQLEKNMEETREKFRSELVATNDIYYKKFKRVLAKYLNEQESQIIENINATSKSFEDWLFHIKEESEKLATLLIPVILELMKEQSKDVANFITGEDIVITPEMEQMVVVRLKQISGVYNTDTIKALNDSLTQGQMNNESLAKMKKRVESVYQDAKGYRAERIARTESLRSSNETAELVYKNNGYKTVRWFTNPGACDFCATFEGQVKEIGGSYAKLGDVLTLGDGKQMSIGYDDVNTPPLHPNCECSLVPED